MGSGEADNEFGSWKDANLRLTAQANPGVGADAGVPPPVRFRSSVAKLVRKRLAVRGAAVEPAFPAVFLLSPSPPATAAALTPKRVPRLDNGMHAITGRVWFVGAGPGSGHWISVEHDDDDDLMTFVTDTIGLPTVPAMMFDPRLPEVNLRYYPNGLGDLDAFEDIDLSQAEVTIDAVTKVIEATHRNKMITPDAQIKAIPLWVDRDKWWPYENAEDRVQGYLEIALNAAFPTCTVRAEQDGMAEGRLDLEIIENDPVEPSKVTQHGIIELKVLRSFGSTGRIVTKKYTNEWIQSGVEQAAAYRDSPGRKAKWAALACFDMRKEDTGDELCFKHVKTLAKNLDVHLRRWFLHATSKQLRSALAAAKS